jgi:hypothetical protein
MQRVRSRKILVSPRREVGLVKPPLSNPQKKRKRNDETFWNCRGPKKKGVATFLKNLIACLQETMIKNCDDKIIRKFDAQKEYLWRSNPAKGKSGGILVGVKIELYDVGAFYQGEFMLQMNL